MLRYGFPLGVHGLHGQYSGATTTTLDLTDPQQAEMLRWWEEQAVPPVEEEEEEDGLVEAERWMEEFVCWPRSPSPSSTFSQDADGNAIEDAWRHDDRSVAGVAQAQSQFQSQSPGVMGVNGNANANAASPPGTGSTCINKSPEPETPPHHPLPLPLPSMFPEEEDTTLQDGRCASPSYPRPPPPSMAGSPGPNGGGSGALRAGMATLSPQRTTIFLRDEEEGRMRSRRPSMGWIRSLRDHPQ
ncbi:hypothetical protein BO86DRAFT_392474 [Aspergillus japonicus CBS 114.51]|uniref:Uncharacterized protein n=1 Tax=Aspergillus japonicus CBS 114.51 TaxID=1448312 RepID=A0A8T8WP22_ASPJA|nr:hypothetical protein BO86DRAFT_392474 [Aspergillus japonicus CBS 114.51]RAH77546.1 hypothetical protein BO86DRAFT_392474 [Aspergillus japonicus CBS 114.51]